MEEILILFGKMTFLQEDLDGEFKAIVHSIEGSGYVDESIIDDVAEDGLLHHDAYLIPSQYNGVIVYDEGVDGSLPIVREV